MIHITNEPELSTFYNNQEVKDLLFEILKQLNTDPYSLKHLLKKGHKKVYNEIIAQLSKSFVVINPGKERNEYFRVKRCIDNVEFHVGDLVTGYDDKNTPLPISRLYSDDRGLHVRLQVNKDVITWRDLSQIQPIKIK